MRATRVAGKLGWLALAVAAVVAALSACSREASRPFAVAAGPASVTLREFSRQAGVEIAFDGRAVEGVFTLAVNGRFTPREALVRMLAHTDLKVERASTSDAFAVVKIQRQSRLVSGTATNPVAEAVGSQSRENSR